MNAKEYTIQGKFGRSISLDITLPKNEGNAPVLIFLHGFKGFKDWGAWHIVGKHFVEHGFAFVKFNFSHSGVDHNNPRDLTEFDAFEENNFFIELSDTSLVLDWIEQQNGIDKDRIYLIGHSRAGGIALITAKEQDRVKKVVTWAAVSDYHRYIGAWNIEEWKNEGRLPFVNSRTKQVFNIGYPFYEVLSRNESFFNLQTVCSSIDKPVLVVHAKDDSAVPYSQAEELNEWLENSDLMLLESGGHTFDTFHPYDQSVLPKTMLSVCERVLKFIGN